MVHHECLNCGMTATMVVTGAAELAWQDHMATHMLSDRYRSWTWEVVELPFSDD